MTLTATTTPTPTSKPAFMPGEGAARGQVLYPTVCRRMEWLHIFLNEGNTHSFARDLADGDGYYSFSNPPVGRYSIYVVLPDPRLAGITGNPDAGISVYEYETAAVPAVTVPMFDHKSVCRIQCQ